MTPCLRNWKFACWGGKEKAAGTESAWWPVVHQRQGWWDQPRQHQPGEGEGGDLHREGEGQGRQPWIGTSGPGPEQESQWNQCVVLSILSIGRLVYSSSYWGPELLLLCEAVLHGYKEVNIFIWPSKPDMKLTLEEDVLIKVTIHPVTAEVISDSQERLQVIVLMVGGLHILYYFLLYNTLFSLL